MQTVGDPLTIAPVPDVVLTSTGSPARAPGAHVEPALTLTCEPTRESGLLLCRVMIDPA
jgi:hypothetical protein